MQKKDRFDSRFVIFFSVIMPLSCMIVSVLLWRNLVKQPGFSYLIINTETKNIADLFNSQLANILTIIGFFGIITPVTTYLLQRQSLRDERTKLFEEIEEEKRLLNEQLDSIQDKIADTERELANKEKQQTYNLGMHWFMLGNIADHSNGRYICWFYALEQFIKYCPDKNFLMSIDSTLSNIESERTKEGTFKSFSVFGPYNKVAIKVLHRIKRRKDIPPLYKKSASELYETIRDNIREHKPKKK